jgi:GNAT superfamily N-acetyltransferase
VGAALLDTALDYFRQHQRKRVWVCGTPRSAPGALTPGIDDDAYPGVRELFARFGFVLDRTVYSMGRDVIDFDAEATRSEAWASGPEVEIGSLTPESVHDLRAFLAEAWPGGWNVSAREKLQRGELHEMLVARRHGAIVGYCQWAGEHFGPFGVTEADRNQRIGAKLFVEALGRIREADGRYVWMNWADEESRRFFERFGLSVIRRFSVMRKDMPGG